MKVTHDLSTLSWTLAGWTPYLWRLLKTLELGESPQAELRGIRAVVPGSVQQALRNANLLPDWMSQARQAEALAAAVRTSKARFPRIGGILLWCGHDCYPCPANTSIIDFHGNPKPAALALKAVWSRGNEQAT